MLLDFLSGNANAVLILGQNVFPQNAQKQSSDDSFQFTDSGLVGVSFNQIPEQFFLFFWSKKDFLCADFMFFPYPMDQVLLRYGNLFFDTIAIQYHHLTAVHHSRWNRFQCIGGENEMAVGKIDIQRGFGVTIMK